jgi:hypothetical protein
LLPVQFLDVVLVERREFAEGVEIWIKETVDHRDDLQVIPDETAGLLRRVPEADRLFVPREDAIPVLFIGAGKFRRS